LAIFIVFSTLLATLWTANTQHNNSSGIRSKVYRAFLVSFKYPSLAGYAKHFSSMLTKDVNVEVYSGYKETIAKFFFMVVAITAHCFSKPDRLSG
jgi:hypothetical protein